MKIEKAINQLKFPVLLVITLWAVEIYEHMFNSAFKYYGIYPRELDGLKGIIFAPLIHSNFSHLISNTVPLFVLTAVIIFFYRKVAIPSFFTIYILTGFMVWLFARPNYHIGASGVVYGLVSFVFWSGVFRRNGKSIVLALAVLIMYSGYFYGIFPQEERISWESHLFGGMTGIFAAYLFKNVLEEDEIKKDLWEDESDAPEKYFLERDVFEKTKAQRIQEAELRKRMEEEMRRQQRDGGWYSDRMF